jgi:MoxR-like ATPase
VAAVHPLITSQAVVDMATLASTVYVDPSVLDYVSRIAEHTRPAHTAEVRLGLSVRGALNYVRTAKTWAAAQGRSFVVPDDIKDLAIPLLAHRILLDPEAEFNGATVPEVITRILTEVTSPTDRAA